MKTFRFFGSARNLALLSLIAVFMALVRITAECLWLGVWQAVPASVKELEPFLYAAFLMAVSGLALSMLAYYQKFIPVIVLAMLSIAALIVIKVAYNI